MLLGVPCVCTNAGGIPSLADDGKEVLMSEPGDANALCENIEKIFEDESLVKTLSENSMARAGVTHDRENNYKDAVRIYKQIVFS